MAEIPDFAYGASSITRSATSATYRYTTIRRPETRRGNCPVCGKRRSRSLTFEATMSPFNKDPETGQPRTRQQIHEVLRAKASAWVPDFTCQTHAEEESRG